MTNQTDHERARIIEAHDTRAQEAHWGGEPDDEYTETDQPHHAPASESSSSAAVGGARPEGIGVVGLFQTGSEQ